MTTPDPIPSIEAADLTTMPDAILLDVREHDEWAAGHAPEAVHIPLGVVTPEGTAGHVI